MCKKINNSKVSHSSESLVIVFKPKYPLVRSLRSQRAASTFVERIQQGRTVKRKPAHAFVRFRLGSLPQRYSKLKLCSSVKSDG
jgi:hypothetical protein